MINIILEAITKIFGANFPDVLSTIVFLLKFIIELGELFAKYKKAKIIKAPGYTFSIFGKLIFTKKSYERVVEPAITMMQEEYFEAYSQKRFAMARWIRFRFFFIFLQILGMNLPLISSLLELKEKFTSK